MDEQVIFNKIESLRRCVDRIGQKTPQSSTELLKSYDLQDIISVNLERAVQNCVDIAAHIIADLDVPPPATMTESFHKLAEVGYIDDRLAERMQKAAGFRNLAVHAYQDIDWEIVYKIITLHLCDFSDFVEAIVAKIEVT